MRGVLTVLLCTAAVQPAPQEKQTGGGGAGRDGRCWQHLFSGLNEKIIHVGIFWKLRMYLGRHVLENTKTNIFQFNLVDIYKYKHIWVTQNMNTDQNSCTTI